MQDVLYEETSVCERSKAKIAKFKTMNTLSIVFLVLTIVWLIFAVSFFPINEDNVIVSIIIILLPSVLCFVAFYLMLRFRNNIIIDYDYSIVGDSIRISKVNKDSKRVHLVNFTTYSIECIGKVGSYTYEKYSNQANTVKYIFTENDQPSEGKGFYYIVASVESEKKLMVLECTERILSNILKTAKSTVLERDYKQQ